MNSHPEMFDLTNHTLCDIKSYMLLYMCYENIPKSGRQPEEKIILRLYKNGKLPRRDFFFIIIAGGF